MVEGNSNSSSPAASKGGSSLSAQLHPAGSPKHALEGDASAGFGRQGRRRKTVPPPLFVESLKRLAALHRWVGQDCAQPLARCLCTGN